MFAIVRRSMIALVILLIWDSRVRSDKGPGDLLQDLQTDSEQLLYAANGNPEPSHPETRSQAAIPGGDQHHVARQAMLFSLDTPGYGEKTQTADAHSPEQSKTNTSDRVRHKKLIQSWVATFAQKKEIDRGIDVTDFDLADVRLFMSYDEVTRTLYMIRPESKITGVNKEPCARDRIDAINKNQNPQRNCIRKITIEPENKVGESYKIDVFFAEDLPNNPGTSIVKSLVYMKYFRKKEGSISSFANNVIHKYGRPVFVSTFNEHFFGHGNRDKPRYDLPYLNCCSKISYPYIISLSAGTRFERHMGRIARQTVRAATHAQ